MCARGGSTPPADIRLSVAASPAENGDRGYSAAATLGQESPNMRPHDMSRVKSPDRAAEQHRNQIRQQLINVGLRPREAEARASIAQTHLSDFRRGATT